MEEDSVSRESAIRAAIAVAKRNSLLNARSASSAGPSHNSSKSAPAGFMTNSFRKHPPQPSKGSRPSSGPMHRAQAPDGTEASSSGRPASSSKALRKPSAASLNARAAAWDQAAAAATGDGAAANGSLEEAIAPNFCAWLKRNAPGHPSTEQQQASPSSTLQRPQSHCAVRQATVELPSSRPGSQQAGSRPLPVRCSSPGAGSRPGSSLAAQRTPAQQQHNQQQHQMQQQRLHSPASSHRRAQSPGPSSRHSTCSSPMAAAGVINMNSMNSSSRPSMAPWLAGSDPRPHTATAVVAAAGTSAGSFAEGWFGQEAGSSSGNALSPWPAESRPQTAAAAFAAHACTDGAGYGRGLSRQQAASSSGRGGRDGGSPNGSPGRGGRDSSSTPSNPWGEFGDQLPLAWREEAPHSSLLAPRSPCTSAGTVRTSLASFSMAPELHGSYPPATAAAQQLPTITSETSEAVRGSPEGGSGGPGAFLEQQDAAAALADAMLLWQRLPLAGRTPVGRDSLGAIGLALEQALQQAGAPCYLGVPLGVEEPQAQRWLEQWSAAEQVQGELGVWDRLLQELCRQISVQCHQQGALLTRGVIRQRQLLQQALAAADGLAQGLAGLHGQGAGRVEEVVRLREEAQQAQAAAEGSKAEIASLKQQLADAQEQLAQREQRMRQGRFHLISQEVEAARAKLEIRMAAEADAKLQRQLEKQRAARAAREEEWLGLAAEVLGAEAAGQLHERLAEADARRVLEDSDDEGASAGGFHLATSSQNGGATGPLSAGQQAAANVPSLPGVAQLSQHCDGMMMPSAVSSLLPEELDSEDGASLPPSARRR